MADKKVKKIILDRMNYSEKKILQDAREPMEDAAEQLRDSERVVKRAKGEVEKHKGEKSPKKDYLAELKAAETKEKKASRKHKATELKFNKVKKAIDDLRAERAKKIQGSGQIGQVIPHGKEGMFMVSIMVGKQSITRHCRRVGDHYTTVEGMEIPIAA